MIRRHEKAFHLERLSDASAPGQPRSLRPLDRLPRRATLPWPLLPAVAAVLLLIASPLLPGVSAQGVVQTSALPFGQSATVGGCLRLTVQDYRDRSGDLENYDWVTVVVQNDCTHAVGGMLVELYLVSVNGDLYGRRFWTLEPQQALLPTGTRKERFAIPDPESYSAGAWAMRVLRATKKTLR